MADVTTPSAHTPSAELRNLHGRHDKWVRDVRDPAEENTEGIREITVDGGSAQYAIASLPDGRCAIHWSLAHSCGDYHSHSIPWVAFASRDACMEAFTKAALRHFSPKLLGASITDKQQQAQVAMLQQFDTGLFGFIEPEVSQEATKRDAEIRKIVNSYGFSSCGQ